LDESGSQFEYSSCMGQGVDFIEQFMPSAWNLRYEPILFAQIYSNLASCTCTLRSTYCIFSQIWVHSTLYSVRPTFVKSTQGPYPSYIYWFL
jgi:hypothetical protein